MRAFIVFLLASAAVLPGTAVEVNHVRGGFFEEKDFQRFTEFFGGGENESYRTVRRTDDARSGLYFVIELDTRLADFPPDAVLRLELIPLGEPQATVFTLDLSGERGRSRELYAGVTGTDWPEETGMPVAWRMTFLDGSGRELAQRQSFLWEFEPR